MRLYEFEVEPPINAILRDYKAKGFSVIGRGASALVMGSDSSNDIIKVGPTTDCWLHVAKLKSSNSHLPVIKSLQTIGSHYLAVVEKLKPVKETFFKTGLFQCIVAWLVLNGKWSNGRDVYLNRYTPDQVKEMAASLEKEKPDMVRALDSILNVKGSCAIDMHPDNMMRRPSDNTLVFQDPLADISHV